MKKLLPALVTLIFALFFVHSSFAQVGTLSGSKTFAKGESFDVDIKINTTESVTGAKVYISFDKTKLTGQSIDTSVSAFKTVWPEATFDNDMGLVKLQAAQAVPGVVGSNTFVRLRYLAKDSGEVDLTLDPSSLILTSDDRNLITSYATLVTFTITSPAAGFAGSSGSTGSSGSSGSSGSNSSSSYTTPTSSTQSSGCSKSGDVDCNGKVDIVDLSKLLANWRKNFSSADFDRSGTIDIVDLSKLLANWGK